MSTQDQQPAPEAGDAPPIEEEAAAAERPRSATSRPLWLLAYLVIVGLLVARIPQLQAYVDQEMPQESLDAIGDPELEQLAVRSAIMIGIVLLSLVAALYLSLAAVLERKVFTARIAVGKRTTFGLYFLVTVLCLVPGNLFSLVTGVVAVREHLWYFLYLGLVGAAAPFAFRSTWKGLPGRKIALLFATTIGLTALTAAA
ncbi:hypothetical protein LO763_19160 [Glycomyces sp. A-F 0318]|uniref:hypothetical protein n=1 Tax=Glycomyces amatae TaxID=2881355 RepID=UPI001E4AED24|nr:hypothetical protein [Glycomyces amatae]MCD0445731.1 hypothetical protein [Glycomyces amatae]